MTAWQPSGRLVRFDSSHGRKRLMLALGVVCLFVQVPAALGYSLVISNGHYYDLGGVYAARHSLTKVDVQNTGSSVYEYACENALNADTATWAQSSSYCAPAGVYVYHPFCGCRLRFGWNGPQNDYGAWMVGIEYY